jgi:putative protein kinase ArgK-like GTPase of G3E family
MQSYAARRKGHEPPIVKTVAIRQEGIDRLAGLIQEDQGKQDREESRYRLLAERAYLLIREQKMKGISQQELAVRIKAASDKGPFNLYQFVLTLSSQTSSDKKDIS